MPWISSNPLPHPVTMKDGDTIRISSRLTYDLNGNLLSVEVDEAGLVVEGTAVDVTNQKALTEG